MLTKATPDGLGMSGDILFARHQFTLSPGNDECMNYDLVLSTYSVQGNSLYDRSSDPDEQKSNLDEQKFSFSYEGQKKRPDGTCARTWQAKEISELGNGAFPPHAPDDAKIGFPSDLIGSLGFGL